MKTVEEIKDHLSYQIYSLINLLSEIQNGAVDKGHLPLVLHEIKGLERLLNFIEGKDEPEA